VHPQIGVSQFRIDLGVVHPTIPGRYLAGVECDGATYHRSATARDRDLLREQVLRDLGWNILRIWSTDFWLDPNGTIAVTDNALRQYIEVEQEERQETEEQVEESTSRGTSAEDGPHVEQFTSVVTTTESKVETISNAQLVTYIEAPPFHDLKPSSFWEDSYRSTLRQYVKHIIQYEGPIRVDVLARKVARAHNMARTGNRILKRVKSLLPSDVRRSRDAGDSFVWPPGVAPEDWDIFRTGVDRNADEIAIEELVALASTLVGRGIHDVDLVTEMGRELGLSRVRRVTRERLDKAADLAVGRSKDLG
jgi:hypothetical protein